MQYLLSDLKVNFLKYDAGIDGLKFQTSVTKIIIIAITSSPTSTQFQHLPPHSNNIERGVWHISGFDQWKCLQTAFRKGTKVIPWTVIHIKSFAHNYEQKLLEKSE